MTPEKVAAHWALAEHPLECLQHILSDPVPVHIDGGVTLKHTKLVLPTSFFRFLVTRKIPIAIAILRTINPVSSGLSLITASRKSSPLAARVWAEIKHLVTIPPLLSGALSAARPDLQEAVATIATILLNLAPFDVINTWLNTVASAVWKYHVGTLACSQLVQTCAFSQIQCVSDIANPSVVFEHGVGLRWLRSDKVLIFLLLLFGRHRYITSIPALAPDPIHAALQAPWLQPLRRQTTNSTDTNP